MVRIQIGNGKSEPLRALCDSGSQPNLITQNVIRTYSLKPRQVSLGLAGISGDLVKIRQKIRVKVFPWFDSSDYIEIDLWVIPKESKWKLKLPDRDVNKSEIALPPENRLADPLFWKQMDIKLLLGVGAWARILKSNSEKLDNALVRQETMLGSVIMGEIGNELPEVHHTLAIKECDYKGLEKLLKRLWEIDQVPTKPLKGKEQILVEKIYSEKRTISEGGKYSVPLILRSTTTEIGDSRQTALKRFFSLERKFKREPNYHQQYVEFMREYEKLGHMVRAPERSDSNGLTYYIPHHGIISSKSFKVVFDCSAKTNKGISLNDLQYKGPKLQRDLYDILLRARRFQYGISVDVRKMFRQIGIIPEHWELQRIFWRENSDEPLREYFLTTVIYGQTSSPVNAVMVMHEGAEKMREKYPRAVEFIEEDFYMDDGFSGAETEKGAIKLCDELEIVFDSMNLPLDKWKSNSKNLMKALKGEETSVFFEDPENQTILGTKWDLTTDSFTYAMKESKEVQKWTRRSVLSKIASIFDPIGHLAPVSLLAKTFMQILWKTTKSWDEEVSDEFKEKWLDFWNKIHSITNVKIPRWVGSETGAIISLHGFSDASSKGLGAVIYVRVEKPNGDISVTQLTAKSKVAPMNLVSIPRLELAAATLLVKLMHHVRKNMEWEFIPYFLQTDSMVTLQWLKKEPVEMKMFVGNRVSYIQEFSDVNSWSHVKSEENPADLASRGLMPDELANCELWWQGPLWLRQPKSMWPNQPNEYCDENEIEKELKVFTIRVEKDPLTISMGDNEVIPLMEYTNNMKKLLRIWSYVMRFIKGARKMNAREGVAKNKRKVPKLILLPTDEEKSNALRYFIMKQQAISYRNELNGNMKESDLLPLNPFIDKEGILRMGGRLRHANLPEETRMPIIIPPKSRLSWLLIHEAHETLEHGHIQVMMQYLRSAYWIPRMRQEMRVFVNRCVVCQRYIHPLETQFMADLPAERVNQGIKPFRYTGVDYAGPIEIKEFIKTSPRRFKSKKAWIAIFVCLQTRAIYIDLVVDLTSLAFVNCFERLVSRRGECVKLFSDNATTFVGASKELKEAFKAWNVADTHEKLNSFGTTWEFMTPGAPHQGGIYEASVKSAKYHLRRVMGSKSCTYDDYITFLAKIEAILNSRPLYAITDDPNDIQPLTPGHFLALGPLKVPMTIKPPKRTVASQIRLWRDFEEMRRDFWRQWVSDYVPTLQKRGKWQTKMYKVKIGQIVIIKDENLPPAQWLLGRVIELIPGKDGLVRSVKIKTQCGELMRPVQKICILPVDDAELETYEANTQDD